jgi:hypothetical protein
MNSAQTPSSSATSGALTPGQEAAAESVLLTLILKHDQSHDLDAIQSKLKAKEWWSRFPVPGTEVVSWVVAVGLGQVVVIKTPPSLIPAINVELERSAWGVFQTECYASYDFLPVRARIIERVKAGGQ